MFGNKQKAIEKAIRKHNADALIEMAEHKNTEVSIAAISGLAAVGGQAASDYLVTRLGSEEAELRIAVAHALGEIGNVHTKAFIFAQMNLETDSQAEEAMRQALSKIKSV